VVESFGGYIIKPPHHLFEELPQNEDLTMKMACCFGIDTPVHGMIYNKDGSLSYFIKRFDRKKGKNKVPVEDFSQLLGFDRDTKYDASTEKLIAVLDEFTTFPYIEKLQFFRRMLFNFLVGNEDMHLKNYSLIVENGVKRLSPAYDLLNTTIVIKTGEQLALPLNGKKSNLKKHDFLDYLALKRLHLKNDDMSQVLAQLSSLFPKWESLIDRSFLSIERKQNYKQLLRERKSILIS
jgi:serine/threonine-protein kinase HipA